MTPNELVELWTKSIIDLDKLLRDHLDKRPQTIREWIITQVQENINEYNKKNYHKQQLGIVNNKQHPTK